MHKVIRCRNEQKHQPKGVGNILFAFEGDRFYMICGECHRWTEIKISIPGIKLDFSNAAMVQQVMPKSFKMPKQIGTGDISRAAVVIKDETCQRQKS
ncbi:MAG TPA: hypothetical protein VMV77_05250 [Bacteroidales bacterium]|nr:hypothetical protein [Bacteroidales bacterium]